MKIFASEEFTILTSALQKALDYLHQKETLTEQVSDLLDLLIPGDGHRLLTVGEWHHTPALESEVIGWLAEVLGSEEEFRPKRVKTLMDGDCMVAVRAEHMIDDHWKVSVFNIVVPEADAEVPEFPDGDPGRNPAMAVAPIVGSADRVPRTGPKSARLS